MELHELGNAFLSSAKPTYREGFVLIVALDPPPGVDVVKWISRIFEEVKDVEGVAGFKVGLPAIVERGAKAIGEVFKGFDGLVIADLKLADIGDVMALTLERLANAGFNAVIAHSFVGVSKALDTLASRCRELGVKLILVTTMSHPGATEVMDPSLGSLLRIVKEVNPWGVVAPATRLEILSEIRRELPNVKILSPGVGVQGAEPGDALCRGADYEIVGRAITRSPSPREAATKIVEMQRAKLATCRP